MGIEQYNTYKSVVSYARSKCINNMLLLLHSQISNLEVSIFDDNDEVADLKVSPCTLKSPVNIIQKSI